MSDEMERIFGTGEPLWKEKYKISWCDLCQTFSASCPEKDCHGSSCNCGGCEKCIEDLKEFNKTKPWPVGYLTDQERLVIEKYRQIKRFLSEGYKEGQFGIDWDRLYYNGRLCENDWELFDLKYEPYDTACSKPENAGKFKF